MIKILNKMLYVLKLLLLLVSFGLSFYIITFMYQRLEKSLVEAIPVFLPYVFIFVVTAINMIGDQKAVKDNFFYNAVSCLVFSLFIYVGYRAIFDPFMIARIRLGYNINFNYYSDMISPLQIMLYGLTFANIFLMFTKPSKKKVEEVPVMKPETDIVAKIDPEVV